MFVQVVLDDVVVVVVVGMQQVVWQSQALFQGARALLHLGHTQPYCTGG
jgi:hypothetical protein